MSEQKHVSDVIDITRIMSNLRSRKKVFAIVLPCVFVLSCIWIVAVPRYYRSSVSLAPEAGGEDIAGGSLSSLASSFGVNLGGGNSDAIYPLLYPELMSSNEFVVGLLGIKVTTADHSLTTDYYTYLTKHQKKNWLKAPFARMMANATKWLSSEEPSKGAGTPTGLNAFNLSRNDYDVVENVKGNIVCNIDMKTNVATITVTDQDPLVAALLADSVRTHLQDFIIGYRTSKARLDVAHYQKLVDDAKAAYDKSMKAYSAYCDANQDVVLQSYISRRDELESDMQLAFNTYSAMRTQLEAMKAKLQERTPAFTVLQCATVPVRPAGPKRMFFVLGMCIFATFVTSLWLSRKILLGKE